MAKREVEKQQEINRIKKEMGKVDDERLKNLEELRVTQLRLKDREIQDDIRNNYIYHILFNNWKNREKVLKSMNR